MFNENIRKLNMNNIFTDLKSLYNCAKFEKILV